MNLNIYNIGFNINLKSLNKHDNYNLKYINLESIHKFKRTYKNLKSIIIYDPIEVSVITYRL